MTHVEKGAYKPLAHPRSGTKGCSARKVRFASARFKKAKGAAPSQLRKLRCLRPGENAPSRRVAATTFLMSRRSQFVTLGRRQPPSFTMIPDVFVENIVALVVY